MAPLTENSTDIVLSSDKSQTPPVLVSTEHSIPPWAIAMVSILSILVFGFIVLFFFVCCRRRQRIKEQNFGSRHENSKFGYRSPVCKRVSEKSTSDRLPSKSPVTRVRSITMAMMDDRSPVLPRNRLAMDVRRKKGRTPSAGALIKGKLLSESGKLPPEKKKRSTLKLIHNFFLGHRVSDADLMVDDGQAKGCEDKKLVSPPPPPSLKKKKRGKKKKTGDQEKSQSLSSSVSPSVTPSETMKSDESFKEKLRKG